MENSTPDFNIENNELEDVTKNNNEIQNEPIETEDFEETIDETEETEEVETDEKPKRKSNYKGFSFKERLFFSILIAITFPLSTVFFGTFELYSGNMDEFLFSLNDFFGYCIGLSLLLSIITFAILFPMRKRFFDVTAAIFTWLSVMMLTQGNYLSRGVITGFIGDGNTSTISFATKAINLAIWLLVGALLITAILVIKNREAIKTAITVIMIIVIAMPLSNFAVTSLTSDVYTPVTERNNEEDDNNPKVLTSKYITEISTNRNVIFFLVDRFDARYAESAMKEMPELFENLDGFTYYDDNISLYPRTYPAVTYMLTGIEQDFTKNRREYFKYAYKNADGLNILHDQGYKVNIFSDSYYTYENANVMSDFAANLSGEVDRRTVNKFSLALDMIKGSLYFRVPFALSEQVGSELSTPLYEKYVVFEADAPKYDIDNKSVYYTLTGGNYTENTDSNTFSFIHMQGSHLPNAYDENWNEIDSNHPDAWDEVLAVKVSMQSINAYINKMKEMGVYKDATIIITGDHAAAISDKKPLSGVRRTALFMKKSGDCETPLVTSSKQVSQENLWASIIESEGIETDIDFGVSMFDIKENEDMTRYYFFQRLENGAFENIKYEIKGSSKKFGNWNIIDREFMDKSIYK